MSKAFVKESASDEELPPEPGPEAETLPAKNYITPAGYARMKAELKQLVEVERPEVVRTVAWAVNGDRSEAATTPASGARDRPARALLIKRLEARRWWTTGPRRRAGVFGARVRLRSAGGAASVITIVGADEVDPARGRISWHSPVEKALLKARDGDVVRLETPGGAEQLEILEVQYPPID
jgi:transcription elongation factor GreB